ncbi:hypothetical protein BTZ20_2929 [Rhodococcus sp. MTM3W5.2]|nr:hypothetical protein BTZ20_2929 [Rhodococcus sp. MTM3W5.2]
MVATVWSGAAAEVGASRVLEARAPRRAMRSQMGSSRQNAAMRIFRELHQAGDDAIR